MTVASLLWLLGLLLVPELQGDTSAFAVSVGLIALNALYSLGVITTARRVPVVLNLVQLALFGVLSSQLASAYGPEHYHFDRTPLWYDWTEFLVAHVFRAADLLDAIDEYGIPIQTITHESTHAGIILVGMHLSTDVFLLALLVRWWGSFAERRHDTLLVRERRLFAFFLLTVLCLSLYAILATAGDWSLSSWLLWPVDNVLRVLDIGDAMQIFGWRLHDVPWSPEGGALALLFRFTTGIWVGALLLYLRVVVAGGWGYSVPELAEHLEDGTVAVRTRAAVALGECPDEAEVAVPALMQALEDWDPAVRISALRALGQLGLEAWEAIPAITGLAWRGPAPVTLEAVRTLGRMGSAAVSEVEPLRLLARIFPDDPLLQDAVLTTLEQIAAAVRQEAEAALASELTTPV
jgi:hypothetical protein